MAGSGSGWAWGQAAGKPEAPPKSRREAMRRLAGTVTVAEMAGGKPGPPLALRAEPLILYGNAGRGIREGTLWALGEGGRPAAVMKVEHWPGNSDRPGRWAVGVSVLSPRFVSVDFRDGYHWTSRTPGVDWRTLPDSPPPAGTAAQRLTQAKTLARRFDAHVDTHREAGTIQLRLLPKPVDRYEAPGSGLLDGVLFGFVDATNPVVLLALEAWTDGGGGAPTWRYGFARFGHGEATARLDGKKVWTVPFFGADPAGSDQYVTHALPEGAEDT